MQKQNFNQKFIACQILKSQGNLEFRTGGYHTSVELYEQAVSIFRYIYCKETSNKDSYIEMEYIDETIYDVKRQEKILC